MSLEFPYTVEAERVVSGNIILIKHESLTVTHVRRIHNSVSVAIHFSNGTKHICIPGDQFTVISVDPSYIVPCPADMEFTTNGISADTVPSVREIMVALAEPPKSKRDTGGMFPAGDELWEAIRDHAALISTLINDMNAFKARVRDDIDGLRHNIRDLESH